MGPGSGLSYASGLPRPRIALTVSLMQFLNLLGKSAAEDELVIDFVPGATISCLLCGRFIRGFMAHHRDIAANFGPGKWARG